MYSLRPWPEPGCSHWLSAHWHFPGSWTAVANSDSLKNILTSFIHSMQKSVPNISNDHSCTDTGTNTGTYSLLPPSYWHFSHGRQILHPFQTKYSFLSFFNIQRSKSAHKYKFYTKLPNHPHFLNEIPTCLSYNSFITFQVTGMSSQELGGEPVRGWVVDQ